MQAIPTATVKTVADARRYADDVINGQDGYRIVFKKIKTGRTRFYTQYWVMTEGTIVHIVTIDPNNGIAY